MDAEGELAVVIGPTARHLTADDALDAVLGYTVANDVTARDLQQDRPAVDRRQGAGRVHPARPVDRDRPRRRATPEITVGRNGHALRGAATPDLARDVVEVLVYVTSMLTLGPGDVVLTGAPGEAPRIRPGDTVSDRPSPDSGQLVNPVPSRRRRVPAASRPRQTR